jgi:hypothetical protein
MTAPSRTKDVAPASISRVEDQLDSAQVEVLVRQIAEIGLPRFVGRLNSGLIPLEEGYRAVEVFVAAAKQRPFISRLGQSILGRTDSFAADSTL